LARGFSCEAAAASLLLALQVWTVTRPILKMIMQNQTAAPVVVVDEVNTCILPSLEKKVRKTLHQEKISKQNKSMHMLLHSQAHAHTTTLFVKERAKSKDVCCMTTQVMKQVEREFRAHRYGVSLSTPMIN